MTILIICTLSCYIFRVVQAWKESLSKKNKKAADALADPTQYENLFVGLKEAFQAEKYLQSKGTKQIPANAYPSVPVSVAVC